MSMSYRHVLVIYYHLDSVVVVLLEEISPETLAFKDKLPQQESCARYTTVQPESATKRCTETETAHENYNLGIMQPCDIDISDHDDSGVETKLMKRVG